MPSCIGVSDHDKFVPPLVPAVLLAFDFVVGFHHVDVDSIDVFEAKKMVKWHAKSVDTRLVSLG